MNREEIADKLINIARKEEYRYASMGTWYLFADFILSEIAAAEKRARDTVIIEFFLKGFTAGIEFIKEKTKIISGDGQELKDAVIHEIDEGLQDFFTKKLQEIIAANSDHTADAGEMVGGK